MIQVFRPAKVDRAVEAADVLCELIHRQDAVVRPAQHTARRLVPVRRALSEHSRDMQRACRTPGPICGLQPTQPCAGQNLHEHPVVAHGSGARPPAARRGTLSGMACDAPRLVVVLQRIQLYGHRLCGRQVLFWNNLHGEVSGVTPPANMTGGAVTAGSPPTPPSKSRGCGPPSDQAPSVLTRSEASHAGLFTPHMHAPAPHVLLGLLATQHGMSTLGTQHGRRTHHGVVSVLWIVLARARSARDLGFPGRSASHAGAEAWRSMRLHA